MTLAKIAAALRAAAAVLEADEAANESPAPKPAKGKKSAAESAPPAASPAPAAATAPAAAPSAPQPEATTLSWKDINPKSKTFGQTLKGIEALNGILLYTASRDRDKAVGVLGEFKVARTPELKVEQYQAVFDRLEEELAKIDAAATQSLV